jgi:hypothetical protein
MKTFVVFDSHALNLVIDDTLFNVQNKCEKFMPPSMLLIYILRLL